MKVASSALGLLLVLGLGWGASHAQDASNPVKERVAQVQVLEAKEELLLDFGLGMVDLNEAAVSKALYDRGLEDRFDQLVVFTDFPVSLAGGAATALFVPVSNQITGIGQEMGGALPETFDFTERFGSRGELKGVVLMGDLGAMPDNFRDPRYGNGASVLGLLGQETLHQFGAFLTYREGGAIHEDLLGRGDAHWSFFAHTGGSDLEGNRWEEIEPGLFESGPVGGRFGHLDQYLMGFRSAREVRESMFVIRNPEVVGGRTFRPGSAPVSGVVVRGQRIDVSIDMIQEAHGPRVPGAGQSPAVMRQAFVLVSDESSENRAVLVEKLNALRLAWRRYFYEAAEGRGRLLSRIDGLDDLPWWRFERSAEGWAVEGAAAEVQDGGGLLLESAGGEVLLSHGALALPAEEIAYLSLAVRAEGASACGAFVDLEVNGEPAGTRVVALDGQTHTYSFPVDSEGDAEGLRWRFALPVGAKVTVEEVRGLRAQEWRDADRDGVHDEVDNCREESNPVQVDADGDGVGDLCGSGSSPCVLSRGGEKREEGGCVQGSSGGAGGFGGLWLSLLFSIRFLRRRRGGWPSAPGQREGR